MELHPPPQHKIHKYAYFSMENKSELNSLIFEIIWSGRHMTYERFDQYYLLFN